MTTDLIDENVVAKLDSERVKLDFPALGAEVHGHPLVYLDTAASAHKPEVVIEAEARCYREFYSNVHRGLHFLSQKATDAYEGAREKTARFLNAANSTEIVFVRGTTEAINLVAASWGRANVGPGDELLITEMEHHSNIVPWQMLCEQVGARLVVAPIDDHGDVILEEFESRLSPRTKIAAFTYISNALGTVNPVREMISMAHDRDVPVLIDGAQAAPHTRIDVQELGCDFFAFSAHKAYGPTGIGALYGCQALLESMPPYQGGGEMIRSVSFEKTEYAVPPYRFEAGTPNIAGAVGMGAALDYLEGLGLDAVAAHEAELLNLATKALADIPGARHIGTAKQRAGVLSFVLDGIHAHDVGTILDQSGVAVRAGHHCAQPVMDHFQVPATSRASFALYNTASDVDRLMTGIRRVMEVFG